LHKDGEPANCTLVEKNFLRILDDDLRYGATSGTAAEQANAAVGGTAGVHRNDLTSGGTCAADTEAAGGTSVGACAGNTTAIAANATFWGDVSDSALKVSYWIREGAGESEGAAEVGANAVHIQGFTDAFAAGSGSNGAVITNQQRLTFDANSTPPNRLLWDPTNFEFPNLGQAYGNTSSPVVDGAADAAAIAAGNQDHFDAIRRALDVDSLVNEWADNDRADADWIVTLPGQYAMRDGVCQRYAVEGPKTACANYTVASQIGTDGLKTDDDQLPLYLVDGSRSYVSGIYAFQSYDREEGTPTAATAESGNPIDFSPSSNDSVEYETQYLRREVNVVAWGSDDGTSVGSAAKQSAEPDTHGLVQVIGTGDLTEGWSRLDLVSTNTTPQPAFIGASNAAGTALPLAVRASAGSATKPGQANYLVWGTADANDIPAVGLAVWKREFADNASGNYGRAIEHSIVVSSGSCGYMNNGTETNSNGDARTGDACDRG
jgi:hypothetical protein